MAVAATGRTEDAYAVGRITALEARSVGVPWIFAPVADVNSDPSNPIINIRSFGEDPSASRSSWPPTSRSGRKRRAGHGQAFPRARRD